MKELIQAAICIWELAMPFLYAEKNLDRKDYKTPSEILWFLGMGVNLVLMLYHRNIVMYSWMYMLFCILISVLLMKSRYHARWGDLFIGNAIYYNTVYFFDLMCIIFLPVKNGTPCTFYIMENLIWERIWCCLVGRSILTFLIYWIHKKRYVCYVYKKNRIMFAIMPIVQFVGLHHCDGTFNNQEAQSIGRGIIISVFYMFFFFFSIVLYLNGKYEYEKQSIIERNRLVRAECERILVWNRERDYLLHDFSNHMIAMESLISEGRGDRAKEYIHSIMKQVTDKKNGANTMHPIVDAMLDEKLNLAARNKISTECKVCQLRDNFVEDQDWCIILSNLLDNAIEACDKVQDNKFLQIKIEELPFGIALNIANSCSDIKSKYGKLRTTKTNKIEHGLGLNNVERVAGKYDGEVCYRVEQGLFQVVLILFKPDGGKKEKR